MRSLRYCRTRPSRALCVIRRILNWYQKSLYLWRQFVYCVIFQGDIWLLEPVATKTQKHNTDSGEDSWPRTLQTPVWWDLCPIHRNLSPQTQRICYWRYVPDTPGVLCPFHLCPDWSELFWGVWWSVLAIWIHAFFFSFQLFPSGSPQQIIHLHLNLSSPSCLVNIWKGVTCPARLEACLCFSSFSLSPLVIPQVDIFRPRRGDWDPSLWQKNQDYIVWLLLVERIIGPGLPLNRRSCLRGARKGDIRFLALDGTNIYIYWLLWVCGG